MKKTLISIFFAITAISSTGQFSTTLFVNARPPATLSEWDGKKEVLLYSVSGPAPGGAQPQVKIKAEIKLFDGTVVAFTDLANAPVQTLRTQLNLFDAGDVLPLQAMIFNGKFKTSYQRTGKLPSDNYQVCVQVVDPVTFSPQSGVTCFGFFIASLQLPILMKPHNEEELDASVAQTAIMFRWTPPVPKPATPVKYTVQVFEVLPNQNPVQAMRSNFPILNQEVISITQYIWQPRGILKTNGEDENIPPDTLYTGTDNKPKKTARYVWTVQSTDMQGKPLGDGNVNGDGRSEPYVFFVNPPATKMKEEVKKLQKKE